MDASAVNYLGNGQVLYYNTPNLISIILATATSKLISTTNTPPTILSVGDWDAAQLYMRLLPDDARVTAYSEIPITPQPDAYSFDVLTMLNPAVKRDLFDLPCLLENLKPQGLFCIALFEEEHLALHLGADQPYMDSSTFLDWCQRNEVKILNFIPIFAPIEREFLQKMLAGDTANLKHVLDCDNLTDDQLKLELMVVGEEFLNLNSSLYVLQV